MCKDASMDGGAVSQPPWGVCAWPRTGESAGTVRLLAGVSSYGMAHMHSRGAAVAGGKPTAAARRAGLPPEAG